MAATAAFEAARVHCPACENVSDGYCSWETQAVWRVTRLAHGAVESGRNGSQVSGCDHGCFGFDELLVYVGVWVGFGERNGIGRSRIQSWRGCVCLEDEGTSRPVIRRFAVTGIPLASAISSDTRVLIGFNCDGVCSTLANTLIV